MNTMPKTRRLTMEAAHWRTRAASRLCRGIPAHPEDALDALLSDAVADLIRAAHAEGFTREEIRKAVYKGAFNGWAEVRGDSEVAGYRFARAVGEGGVPVGMPERCAQCCQLFADAPAGHCTDKMAHDVGRGY
jgi:hypothetical protein